MKNKSSFDWKLKAEEAEEAELIKNIIPQGIKHTRI